MNASFVVVLNPNDTWIAGCEMTADSSLDVFEFQALRDILCADQNVVDCFTALDADILFKLKRKTLLNRSTADKPWFN